MSELQETVLSIRHLTTEFALPSGNGKAVDDLSFEILKGETLGIVGESGCGKSMTALSILNLVPSPPGNISSGEIFLENRNLLKLDDRQMREVRGKDISMIFQEPMTSLNPVLTIGYQIEEVLQKHLGLSKADARKKTTGLLELVKIPEAEKRALQFPHQLSGGMRQRAMIAMAMACNPKILIADEPTTALDVTIQAQIFELMDKLKKENDTAIILITHDMGVVAELADNVAVMYMGNIVEAGTADDVLRRPTHPYTKALLESVPVLGRGKNQDINPIKGSTPDPYNRPIGCQFAPRCNWQTESCDVMPEITQINETHQVRCHKYEQFFEKYK